MMMMGHTYMHHADDDKTVTTRADKFKPVCHLSSSSCFPRSFHCNRKIQQNIRSLLSTFTSDEYNFTCTSTVSLCAGTLAAPCVCLSLRIALSCTTAQSAKPIGSCKGVRSKTMGCFQSQEKCDSDDSKMEGRRLTLSGSG